MTYLNRPPLEFPGSRCGLRMIFSQSSVQEVSRWTHKFVDGTLSWIYPWKAIGHQSNCTGTECEMSLNNCVTVGIGLGLALVSVSTHSLASPGVEPVPGHVDGTVYSANGNAEAVAPPAAAGTEPEVSP